MIFLTIVLTCIFLYSVLCMFITISSIWAVRGILAGQVGKSCMIRGRLLDNMNKEELKIINIGNHIAVIFWIVVSVSLFYAILWTLQ